MSRRNIKLINLIVLLAASLIYAVFRVSGAGCGGGVKSEYSYVERVVDGDTLKLSDGNRVRLIGVDTPEVHESEKLYRDAKRTKRDVEAIISMGRKAASFTRALCERKKVRLEFDVQRRDKYRRLLAYVYLEDGTFLNAKILEEGYGQVMTIPPNVKYANYFLQLQKTARENNKGLWSEAESF